MTTSSLPLNSDHGYHVVIVGGGASGTIALIRGMELLPPQTRFTIIEPRATLGLGRAYSTQESFHLLNVPTEKMSLFPNQPNDFKDWIKLHHSDQPGPFVPRMFFAEYIQERLQSIPLSRYEHCQSKVQSFERLKHGWNVTTEGGHSFTADAVVLATGYENTPDLSVVRLSHPALSYQVIQPYDFEGLKKVKATDKVLIVGTGLTALDAFLSLNKQGVSSIQMVSRHGFLPIPHPAAHDAGVTRIPPLNGLSPLQILRLFRSYLSLKSDELVHLVQEIRVQTTQIWTCWTPVEKRQFLNHVKPYWEVIRHRMPQSVAAELKIAKEARGLQIQAARILSTRPDGRRLEVTLQPRGSSQKEKKTFDWIVLATETKIDQSLQTETHGSGPEKCGFGFGYTPGPAKIWSIGPTAKCSFWESTAIPDITRQIESTLADISRELGAHESLSRLSDHPYQLGETYRRHFRTAFSFALVLMKDALILAIHSLIPYLYTDYVSDHLPHLSKKLTRRKVLFVKRSRFGANTHSHEQKTDKKAA